MFPSLERAPADKSLHTAAYRVYLWLIVIKKLGFKKYEPVKHEVVAHDLRMPVRTVRHAFKQLTARRYSQESRRTKPGATKRYRLVEDNAA